MREGPPGEPLDLAPPIVPHLGPKLNSERIPWGPGSQEPCLMCPKGCNEDIDDNGDEDQGGGSIVELV